VTSVTLFPFSSACPTGESQGRRTCCVPALAAGAAPWVSTNSRLRLKIRFSARQAAFCQAEFSGRFHAQQLFHHGAKATPRSAAQSRMP